MPIVESIFLAILSLWSCLLLYRCIRIALTTKEQAQAVTESRGCCDSIGFVGCSILCTESRSLCDVEHLLRSEYNRYEIILTLSAEREHQEFDALIHHFRLIQVNTPAAQDNSPAIKRLFRSRLRIFRRVVLIDHANLSPLERIRAAASVAAFNYIIPLRAPLTLHPLAIEHIALTLSHRHHSRREIICCHLPYRCHIIRQERALAMEPLTLHDLNELAPNATIQPYALWGGVSHRGRKIWTWADLATLAATATGITLLATISWWALSAGIMFLLLVISAAYFLNRLEQGYDCSLRSLLYQIRHLLVFFHRRKFTIS